MWVSWEIPPDPPFSKGGMFCCFRKLAGMRSFPACDPKIASENLKYLPLSQTPNTSPFCKGGRGDFQSRQVMVETEAVMEKIYRVGVERAAM
jgi:hypothetical protein